MTSFDTEQHRRQLEEFNSICLQMGIAIALWQWVEDRHFALFIKMLGAPNRDICSAVYHSTESFESRRIMVSRVADIFLKDTTKVLRTRWNELNKALKTGNENRNKIVHYSMEYEFAPNPDSRAGVVIGPPRLQPYPLNVVSRMIGRTPDRSEHNLSIEEIKKSATEFRELVWQLLNFEVDLTQQQEEASQAPARPEANPEESHQAPSNIDPPNKPPSEQ